MGVALLAPRPPADVAADAVATIAAFMRTGSLEATRPTADDVAALKAAAVPGTHVYLSAVLTRPQEEVVAQATCVRAAGLEPVPAPRGAQLRFTRRVATLSRSPGRRGRRAASAGDRGRPCRAGGPVPRRARSDRLRPDHAQRDHRDRHLGLSGRTSAHCRSRARARARRQARGGRADRAQADDRHAVLPRCHADHRLGAAAARRTASIIRCGSVLPARPALRR